MRAVAGGADDPVAWYEGASFTGAAERFMRPDWQGSIAVVTDTTGGTVIAANTYDEYGIPGAANQGRFQYTGQAWESELGLYYYKARMYSPTLGRFLQTDPIGYSGGQNLYAYVGDDPVDGTDPSGLTPQVACPTFSSCGGGGEFDASDITVTGSPSTGSHIDFYQPSRQSQATQSTQLGVGTVIKLLANGGHRVVRHLASEAAARVARKAGESVKMNSRQMADRLEHSVARNPEDVMRHSGHPLPDGSRGMPHFQTEGMRGHSFWGIAVAVTAGIDKLADVIDELTDFTHVSQPGCDSISPCHNTD